jgi:hypothetical protein
MPVTAAAALVIGVLWFGSAAHARDATLELATGETLTGAFVSQDEATITIMHPVLGELTVPREQITAASIEPPVTDADPVEDANGEAPLPLMEEEEAAEWDVTFSLGLNGSRGASDSDNLRTNFNAERTTERMESTLDITYTLERDEGENTDNRFDALARNEWLVPDSKWRYFVYGRWEVDQFESYDQRFRGGGGAGYELISTERHLLVGRAGIGLVQEQGGERDGETGVEALVALDYEWDIDDRSSFKAVTEWAPDLTEGGKVRARSTAAYELALSDEGDLSLQLGVEHRFDKFENDDKNEFDYFALIVYSF